MTPKEKAKQLVDRFFDEALPDAIENNFHIGVLCALIAVDEILESYSTKDLIYPKEVDYWKEVKQEIENYD